jgi:hypothetical protein
MLPKAAIPAAFLFYAEPCGRNMPAAFSRMSAPGRTQKWRQQKEAIVFSRRDTLRALFPRERVCSLAVSGHQMRPPACPLSANRRHSQVPVEKPSTASKADLAPLFAFSTRCTAQICQQLSYRSPSPPPGRLARWCVVNFCRRGNSEAPAQ